MVAMTLKFAKKVASDTAKREIVDAVITVCIVY